MESSPTVADRAPEPALDPALEGAGAPLRRLLFGGPCDPLVVLKEGFQFA
jgi:hypothetical protein